MEDLAVREQDDHRFLDTADFDLLAQAVIATSAGADLALRTVAASLVTTAASSALPRLRSMRRDAANVAFYADLADAGDVDDVFVRPDELPRVELVAREPVTWRWLPGTLDVVRFPSSYLARNPAVRVRYRAHERNRTAWAQHWRHDDGPRPTILILHGFGASLPLFNRLFFSMPWLFSGGYDLLFVTLPFHGHRARPGRWPGTELFSDGPSRFTEAMLHAIADLRSWIDHLESTGVTQVGIMGLSLGGYLSSLLAAVDDRLHFCIPNAPVTDLHATGQAWFPLNALLDRVWPRVGVAPEAMARAMALHSPLTWPVRLARERLFVIAGLGDRLAPPEQAERLWEHWGRPKVHVFPGNHVLHVERGAYLRRIGTFIRSTGFGVA